MPAWANVCGEDEILNELTLLIKTNASNLEELSKLSSDLAQEEGQAFFWSKYDNWGMCAKTSNCSFILQKVYSLRLLPTESSYWD